LDIAINHAARIKAFDIKYSKNGLQFNVSESDQIYLIETKFFGEYNVSNLLGVIAAMRASGLDLQVCVEACKALTAVPGRMDVIAHDAQSLVVVDYAHTPDALKQAIGERSELAADAAGKLPIRAEQWLGRPILVTRNSYEVGLMNGDIGLVLQTTGGLAAVFPVREDGVDKTREIALARLPEQTGAFAMTVHKSQGSQFRRVAVVLAGRDSPIQTRELVYTAITRTSSRLDWLGDPGELQRALRRRVGRASVLGDLLWRA